MISFYQFNGRFGQLGNQLFEIASTIGIAIKNNQEYSFIDWEYNNYFINPIPTESKPSISFCREFEENSPDSGLMYDFGYRSVKLDPANNWNLKGFFQSERYFEHCKDVIRHHFTLKPKHTDYINKKYGHLFKEKTCSLHVRRGDFLQLHKYHNNLQLDYYAKALDVLYGVNLPHILIFSDDISWCKANFNYPRMTFIENEINIIDMFIMSMCNDHIIANSSFSWWGAWLDVKEDKRVVSPGNNFKWFGNLYASLDTRDLIPDNWIKL
jgi:hypothetical protein